MEPSPVAPDAQPAAPSAAVETPHVEPSDRLANLSDAERLEWRKTGELPAKDKIETTPADSSPAVAVEEQPASTDATSEPDSKPAWDPALLKAETKKRFDDILAGQARERDRADRAERALAESQRPRQPQPTAPAAPSPAPAGLVEPVAENYQYGTADPGFVRDTAKYETALALTQARRAWESEQQQARDTAEQQRIETDFRQRIAESRTKHPDYDAVALTDVKIPPGTLAEFWVKETPAGAEILYHFQQPQNAAERDRIFALPYKDQVIELVRLGDRLTGAAPAAQSTQAPPPPPALRTRATPGDPVERAIKTGDYAAYKRAADERDLAARRK